MREEHAMETQEVQNWFGNITSSPQVVVEPRNVQDLIAVMKDPEAYPSPVRAVGSNHSTTACGVADDGTLVVMRQMNRILNIGPDTVTAEAGALYIDVAKELQTHNLQFFVIPKSVVSVWGVRRAAGPRMPRCPESSDRSAPMRLA
jgi:FAD/FMN-containing dehydrogenase